MSSLPLSPLENHNKIVTIDTFAKINAIIEQDNADTPYKYSLLRSVIECCREYPQYAVQGKGDAEELIYFPTGLLVFKWLIYYYPFFLPGSFIVVKRGETSDYANGRKAAFRDLFEEITRYYEPHGGISVFYDDILHGTTPKEINETLSRLVNKIRQVITDMPMRHLGFSQYGCEYSVFKPKGKAESIRKNAMIEPALLVQKMGWFSFPYDFYVVFRELGGYILGEGSLSSQWMSFLQKTNKNSGVSEGELLRRFSITPISERNTIETSQKYKKLVLSEDVRCVWSGKKLSPENLAIDHVLPFSIWKCNDLWNLVPSDAKINIKKSDKIPTVEFLQERKTEILDCWLVHCIGTGVRFEKEVSFGLLGSKRWENDGESRILCNIGVMPGMMDGAFERLCETAEYLIEVRGYEGWRV